MRRALLSQVTSLVSPFLFLHFAISFFRLRTLHISRFAGSSYDKTRDTGPLVLFESISGSLGQHLTPSAYQDHSS
jgi:hypothetical protein